ncbi:MAG: hypothetical protein H0V68_07015 [Actinobacteria bacterium]|nr:hypothetical protein [Actinomycetota bacterium]
MAHAALRCSYSNPASSALPALVMVLKALGVNAVQDSRGGDVPAVIAS